MSFKTLMSSLLDCFVPKNGGGLRAFLCKLFGVYGEVQYA